MTKESRQSSPGGSEASFSTTPEHVVYTPPSEDSRLHDTLSTRPPSRRPSPLRSLAFEDPPLSRRRSPAPGASSGLRKEQSKDYSFSDHEEDDTMDTRPPLHRPIDGRSQVPLLKEERGRSSYEAPNGSARPAFVARRSTFRSRSPDMEGSAATKRKYVYAGFFLALSLVAFVVQTETAEYIQKHLGWKKPYAML